MDKIVLFDTSCGSLNLGDYIICDSVERELAPLLNKKYCVRYSTHTPLSGLASRLFRGYPVQTCKEAKYKFICGTNILSTKMISPRPNWSINIFDCSPYKDAICVGCGSGLGSRQIGIYEKLLYKRVLSSKYVHSVRDERTAKMLTGLGLKAVNTGCPTTWALNQEAIDEIYDNTHADAALFTLTDYSKDSAADLAIFRQITKLYRTVYFWPQGPGDYEYAKKIGIIDAVKVISPSFKAYRDFMSVPFDYVGTRLHGGIYALSHGHRAVIIAVDHRAIDMAVTSGIPVVSRGNMNSLIEMIEMWDTPSIHIPKDAIAEWKEQFN